MPSREARIETLAAANRARHKRKCEAVEAALKTMVSRKDRVTVSAVASRAQVSRNFVYSQSELLERIQSVGAGQADRLVRAQPGSSTEASLRRRLATALDTIEENNRTIADQRATIERLTAELARQMVAGANA